MATFILLKTGRGQKNSPPKLLTSPFDFLKGKTMTMKNTLLPILLSLACLVSCSCSKTETTPKLKTATSGSVSVKPASPPIEIPAPGTYTGSNWSFQLPPTFKNFPLEEMKIEGNTVIEAFFTDRENQRLLTVAKEPMPPSQGLDQFVMMSVAQIMNNGINVNVASHTNLSGLPAGMIDTTSDVLHVWIWLTVKDQIGYTFACGGVELTTVKEIFDECEKISRSFKIK